MKGLDTGKDKIQKICDAIRAETLEPAKQEAREIIENARIQEKEILRSAQKKAEQSLEAAALEMAEKKRVFEASLQMACRQGIDLLKQKVEEALFHRELADLVVREMGKPDTVAAILNSFMKAMEERGIEEDFTAEIPQSITPASISALLGAQALERLKKGSIAVGDFAGGARIKLKGRQVTMDISDVGLRELIARYIRRDFRELVFGA